MLAHGLNGQYELIYNVVDTTIFKPAEKTTTRIQLLHVSSLVEREKNITGTFNVIKKLQERGLDFDFVVIGGEAEQLSAAKNLAQKLEIKNIKFTGVLKPQEVAKYMQQSSALILFSHFEGMPVVVLEALSCKLPVFASKVGQLPYMINQEFGVLTESSDENKMSEALEKLIKGESQYNHLAMREFVLKNASMNSVGKQMSDFYNQ